MQQSRSDFILFHFIRFQPTVGDWHKASRPSSKGPFKVNGPKETEKILTRPAHSIPSSSHTQYGPTEASKYNFTRIKSTF